MKYPDSVITDRRARGTVVLDWGFKLGALGFGLKKPEAQQFMFAAVTNTCPEYKFMIAQREL